MYNLSTFVDDLKEIIKGCQKGNPASQKALYDLFAPKMYGVCLQYCKDSTEAEDCLQDGFIKIFTNIKKYKFKGSFEGWVRRIVVNTTIDSFRKKKPETSLEDTMLVKLQSDTIEEKAIEIGEDEIMNIISKLPPKYRIVFNLYVLEGLSHKEIAEALDIAEGTSKSNLSRARSWIKERITEKPGKKQIVV